MAPAPRGARAPLHRADGARGAHRRHRRDRPYAPRRARQADARRRHAVPRSRARGARRLPARGLLQLPLADDSSVPLGAAAVRRAVHDGRVAVRPPVPVGLQADRSGPGARRGRSTRTSGTTGTSSIRAKSPPGSNMPPYAHLADGHVDLTRTTDKLHAMKSIGVPYTDDEVAHAAADARSQADEIAADLATSGANARQRLGPGRAHRVPAAPRRQARGFAARRYERVLEGAGQRARAEGVSAMYQQLFAHSPLLVLPIAALLIFFSVFVVDRAPHHGQAPAGVRTRRRAPACTGGLR